MTPTALAKDIEKLVKYRIYAFQHGVTTTHWPHEFQPTWAAHEKLPGMFRIYSNKLILLFIEHPTIHCSFNVYIQV